MRSSAGDNLADGQKTTLKQCSLVKLFSYQELEFSLNLVVTCGWIGWRRYERCNFEPCGRVDSAEVQCCLHGMLIYIIRLIINSKGCKDGQQHQSQKNKRLFCLLVSCIFQFSPYFALVPLFNPPTLEVNDRQGRELSNHSKQDPEV